MSHALKYAASALLLVSVGGLGWLGGRASVKRPVEGQRAAACQQGGETAIELARLARQVEALVSRTAAQPETVEVTSLRGAAQSAAERAIPEARAGDVDDGAGAEDPEEQEPDPTASDEAARLAHGVVDGALEARVWTSEDASAFRDLLARVAAPDATLLRNRLAVAANGGQLRMKAPAFLF